MKYSFTSLLFGANALLSATYAQFTPPQDDCDNENFVSSPVSGAPWSKGDGNTYFCDTRWNSGLVICGVQTWAWKFHQRGFRVKYSDGTWGPIHGTQMQEDEKDNWTGDYSKNTIEWDCSQPLKDLRVTSHWPGYSIYKDEWIPDAVGGIRLRTPDDREFFIHGDIGKYPGESFDLATGYLVGARGRSGGFVETLEWKLLASPVASAEIKNMQFTQDLDTLNARSDKVAETTFANIWFINRDSEGQRKFSLSDQRAETVSTAITHSTQHQFGVRLEIGVEAQIGVPLLSSAKVSSKFETSYQLQKMNSGTLTTTREQRMTWLTEGQVKVKSAMHCKAWAFMGRYDDEYVADVEITFRNGKKISVRQPGKFVSVGWTQAVLDCQTKSLSEAPIDATDLTAPNSTVRMLRGRAVGARLGVDGGRLW